MSTLFPKGTSPEQIVKTVILVLQARHQREADRLAQILSAIDDLYIDKLCILWRELVEREEPSKALAILTKIIEAELDGGEMPVV